MQITSRSLSGLGRKTLLGLAVVVAILIVALVFAAAFVGYQQQIEACEKAGGQWVTESDYVPVTTVDSKGNVGMQYQYVSESRCVK